METKKFGLAIHGGAGTIERSKMTPKREREYRAGLESALTAGYEILKRGGSSVDATEAAVRVLEDDPHFNAGKGSVFTSAGTNEMDAAIMEGKTLAAGAVASLKHIKNPISLARLVMEKSGHVMMDCEGAEAFAKENGIELVDQKYFFTQERWDALEKIKAAEKSRTSGAGKKFLITDQDRHGTVGAVALDQNGNLAAATSTGGTTNKLPGRVGDTPVIGAGTYANNATCAVSATGDGEYFIRATVGRDVFLSGGRHLHSRSQCNGCYHDPVVSARVRSSPLSYRRSAWDASAIGGNAALLHDSSTVDFILDHLLSNEHRLCGRRVSIRLCPPAEFACQSLRI
jgi:beta-aspartyl-peptidase (threonine type)